MSALALPLAGVRVVEFVHMVVGRRAGWCLSTSRLPKRLDPPKICEHTVENLRSAGLAPPEIEELVSRGVAASSPAPAFPRR